jgi:hypothetical protein
MDPTQHNLRHWVKRGMILWAAATLYFLSIGPAIIFETKTSIGRDFFAVVYSPIIFLRVYSPLAPPLERYFDFWHEFAEDLGTPSPILEAPPRNPLDIPYEIDLGGQKLRCAFRVYGCDDVVCSSPKPRMSVLIMVGSDKGKLPAGVRLEKAWIIHEDVAWVPRIEETCTEANAGSRYLGVTAEQGPRWCSKSMEAVIQLRDNNGQPYLLRAKQESSRFIRLR